MITVTSSTGTNIDRDITKVKTSGVSYFYEAIFSDKNDDDIFDVLLTEDFEGGEIFVPVRANLAKVSLFSNSGGGAILTVEGRYSANVNNPVSVEIPKFIRHLTVETVGISETGRFALQVLYRRADVSTHKQIIHAV